MESTAYHPVSDSTFFRPPATEDLDRIHAMEAASYPDDEAATYDKLKFRIEHANEAFLLAVRGAPEGDDLIGYTCGTCTTAGKLTHESMGTHEPEGDILCIHSVCVKEQDRRKGHALRLLRMYLQFVGASCPHVREVRLLCKENLIQLYSKAGFSLLGPSDVVHGQDQWFEMAHVLQQQEC